MTETEKNRAVAEACGLPIEKRGDLEFAFVADPWMGFDDQWRAIGLHGGYCPTRDANQAHAAAHHIAKKRGCTYEVHWGYVSFDGDKREGRYECVFGGFASGMGDTPAKAIVAAILAAGGEKS